MKAKVSSFLRKLTVITFLLGTACIILGVLLSAAHLQANAAGNDNPSSELFQQGGLCGDGEPVAVIHNPPYVYTAGLADHVYILTKGPGGTCIFFNHDGTDPEGCYQVSGLAQGHPVSVTEIGLNEECKDIQHVEFYLSHAPAPTHTPVTPSPTCTDTPVTPTNTPVTPTDTPVTPTDTPVTPTPADATLTPTLTFTPGTPTLTFTPGTPTLTFTPTTPTLTFTPTKTSTEPVFPPKFTETPRPPTATPRPSTATPTILPTVLPPAVNTKVPQIIPVTGDDLESRIQAATLPQQMFLNFGAGLLGLALVLFGVSNKFKD